MADEIFSGKITREGRHGSVEWAVAWFGGEDGFIAKFDARNQKLIRSLRKALRKRLPTANELVYDNYNFFVIGYSPTERPSDYIVSLTGAANGIGLSFSHGASLPGRIAFGR